VRVAVEEDEHGGPGREAGKNDHPQRHGFSQDTPTTKAANRATAMA
jgi:hypothetical protein